MKQPHINCDTKDISKYVIIAGDPKRIDKIKDLLDCGEEIAYNREFKTIRGKYKGLEISCTSTGIGGPSAAIAIEELVECGAEYIIRVGSCGAIQENIDLGDLVVATGAVREDGASKMYVDSNYPAVSDFYINREIVKVLEEENYKFHVGAVRSHDSFYVDYEDEIMDYYNEKNILASDMETSILFTLGTIKNIKVGSILNNVVLYKNDVKQGIVDFVENENKTMAGEDMEIKAALETFYRISKK